MVVLPDFPFLVTISITPEAPREPYCAVSLASLRMLKLSMSAGYTDDRVGRSPITPSMMISGSLPPVSDVVPRTRTAFIAATPLSLRVIVRPATRPLIASRAVDTWSRFMSFSVTVSTDPALAPALA